MIKIFIYVLVVLFGVVMFFTPARKYMNNLFYHNKQKLGEEKVIGKVFGYNPRVEEIQKILKESGFEFGPVDGVLGAQTRVAISQFQEKNGLKPTGKIDSETQLFLNKQKKLGGTSFN